MPRKTKTKEASMLAKGFGQRLRKLREERALSQKELAKGIVTETAQISRYERGVVMPNAESLLDLSRFLRVDVGFLLSGQEGKGDHEELPIHDLALLERFRELERLGHKDRDVIMAVIDAMVSSREFEQLSARRTQRTA